MSNYLTDIDPIGMVMHDNTIKECQECNKELDTEELNHCIDCHDYYIRQEQLNTIKLELSKIALVANRNRQHKIEFRILETINELNKI